MLQNAACVKWTLQFKRLSCLITISLVALFSLVCKSNPNEIINNLGAATPTAQFSVFGASGSTISSRQFVGPEFIIRRPTMITEIGAFINNCKSIKSGIPECPRTLPFIVQIRGSGKNRFPDPLIVLGEFVLSHDDDPLVFSYESVVPNIILEPGVYFALFAPQLDDVGSLLQEASNPVPYQGYSTLRVGTLDPFTGLPANVPGSIDRGRIAVRILGTPTRTSIQN